MRSWWRRRTGMAPRRILTMPESYRQLAVKVRFDLGDASDGCALMLNCLDSPEVTYEATMMLATFLAEREKQRVLIIDACFSKGGLAAIFNAPKSPGLLDLVEDPHKALEDVVRVTGNPRVSFMPAGKASQGLGWLPMAAELRTTIDRLRKEYEFILINAPSVLDDASALAFPSLVDCVLVIVLTGVTRSSDADACREALERCKARRVGVIMASR